MGSLLLVHGCPVLLVTRWVHTPYLPSPLGGIKEAEASSLQRSPLHTLFCVPDTLSQFPLPEKALHLFSAANIRVKLQKKKKTTSSVFLKKVLWAPRGAEERAGDPGQKLGEQCISH